MCDFKHQGSRESHATVPSGSGNLHNGRSDSHAQEVTVAKAQTYSQDIGQKDYLQSDLQEASENSLKSDWKTGQRRHAGSPSGKLSSP